MPPKVEAEEGTHMHLLYTTVDGCRRVRRRSLSDFGALVEWEYVRVRRLKV